MFKIGELISYSGVQLVKFKRNKCLINTVDSLSRSLRDPLKDLEISVLGHIRFAELRKMPIQLPNFTNEHVI